jgi:hypothetical protein
MTFEGMLTRTAALLPLACSLFAATAAAAPVTVVQTASIATGTGFMAAIVQSNGGYRMRQSDALFTAIAPAAATLTENGQDYRLASVRFELDTTVYLDWGLSARDDGVWVNAGTNGSYRAMGFFSLFVPDAQPVPRGISLQYYYEEWDEAVWVRWQDQPWTSSSNSVAAAYGRSLELHDVVEWSDAFMLSQFTGASLRLSTSVFTEVWAVQTSDGDDYNMAYVGGNHWLGTVRATYTYEPLDAPVPVPVPEPAPWLLGGAAVLAWAGARGAAARPRGRR